MLLSRLRSGSPFSGISHNYIQASVLELTGLGSDLPQYDLNGQNIHDWLVQHRRP